MALKQETADALAAAYKRYHVAGGRLSTPTVTTLAAQEYVEAHAAHEEAVANAEKEAGA